MKYSVKQMAARNTVTKALAGPQARVALTLSAIPNGNEVSKLINAKCDAVIVDLDGNPDEAIDLVESISSADNNITVMVFGRPDPDLLVRAMRAGAREFLAEPLEPGTAIFSRTGSPWDWAAEVAAACCGLVWDPLAPQLDPALFGGPRFNDEQGRQAYHDHEEQVTPETLFCGGLNQGGVMLRLQRLNRRLGWDHDTLLRLPYDQMAQLAMPALRAALWSALYAGAHVVVESEASSGPGGWLSRFRTRPIAPWDPSPFSDFWAP